MAATHLVSVAEYLSSSYHPDREYLDGLVVERNWGEKTHSRIQRNLIVYLGYRSKALGIEVFPEQRVQVSPTRFRVPDVTGVTGEEPRGEIFQSPPYLCIEILSADDRAQDMLEKIDDYLRFGIPYIWIVNPRNKKGYVATRAGMVEAASGMLETGEPGIAAPLAILFESAK